jgi:hypothetical protein
MKRKIKMRTKREKVAPEPNSEQVNVVAVDLHSIFLGLDVLDRLLCAHK